MSECYLRPWRVKIEIVNIIYIYAIWTKTGQVRNAQGMTVVIISYKNFNLASNLHSVCCNFSIVMVLTAK